MIALLIAGAVAQAAPPPPARDSQADRIAAQLSEGGRSAIQAEMIADRERRLAFEARLGPARQAIVAAARAQPIDVARLRAALEARDAIEIERLRERTASAIALLQRLPAADRAIVAMVIPDASGPAAPPPGSIPLPPPQRRR